MDWRFVNGAFNQPGPATAWLRMRHPLIAGQEPGPLARVLVAADSGNGVSSALPFAHWRFVNPDLTVYLHRMPAGQWLCLDATTIVGPAGVGLATSIIRTTTALSAAVCRACTWGPADLAGDHGLAMAPGN